MLFAKRGWLGEPKYWMRLFDTFDGCFEKGGPIGDSPTPKMIRVPT